ncbi:MAG: glycosyltransferase family 1 protein [Planctomycetota bacterium]|nr:MAG: glycosyltransferase family 1 protein [Planctomycetota bacterium]
MKSQNIGFVSTRFAGTDGVSLESAKWAEVLYDARGHISHWFAGILDRDPGTSRLVPLASFTHPDIAAINGQVFGRLHRDREVTERILDIASDLKRELERFIDGFGLDILIAENALTIPVNIPLGVALTWLVAERGFNTIAHHHDFYWERDRFRVNAVGDFLQMAFPPSLPSIQHVTINSIAQQELSHRRGQSSVLVPNVLKFNENPPKKRIYDGDYIDVDALHPIDDHAAHFREDIGVGENDVLFLQPTRVVPRKGIEHSVALLAQLGLENAHLVITHQTGDEGHEYQEIIKELAARHSVSLIFADEFITDRIDRRGVREDGRRIYTLGDAYRAADFVTYPSLYEGFGNALIEAFFYCTPVMVNRYSIYITDIEPKGFRVVEMNGVVTGSVVREVRRVLHDEQYRLQMITHNYETATRFYSYRILRRKLRSLITNFTGLDDL